MHGLVVLPRMRELVLGEEELADVARGLLAVGFRKHSAPPMAAVRVAEWLEGAQQSAPSYFAIP